MTSCAIPLALYQPGLLMLTNVAVMLLSVGFALLPVTLGPRETFPPQLVFAISGIAFLLGGAGFALALRQRRLAPALLEVGPEGAWIPHHFGHRRPFFVPYADMEVVYRLRLLGQRRLILRAAGGPLSALPERAFPRPEDFDEVFARLQAGVRALPDGEERLARFSAAAVVAEAFHGRRSWLAYTGMALLVAMFAATWEAGGASSLLRAILLGANVSDLTLHGEPWRVLTACWLHRDLFHVVANTSGLLVMARLVEPMLGRARVLVLLGGGAVLGGLLSALFLGSAVSVGMSSAIYALPGAALFLWWDRRDELPAQMRFSPRALGIGLACAVGVELWWPGVDRAAHTGGLLAGLFLTPLLVRRPLAEVVERRAPGPVRLAALAAGAAFAAAAFQVWIAADALAPGSLAAEARARIGERPLGLVVLNEAGWQAAVDPDADLPLLEWAVRRLEGAIGRAEAGSPEDVLAPSRTDGVATGVTDTLATLHYRLGRLDRAVALARSAEARAAEGAQRDPRIDPGYYASQRARFEYARARARGPELALACRPAPAVSFQGGSDGIRADIESGCAGGAAIRAVALVGGALAGYLSVELGPDPPASARLHADSLPERLQRSDLVIVPTRIAGGSAEEETPRAGAVRWRVAAIDPGVQALP